MQKGFKKVAPGLVQARPGLTDKDYAKMALDQGLCRSDSKDRVFSLATTMRKEVREGRMPGIKAVKVNGKLHFFPEDGTPNGPMPNQDRPITVLLPADVAEAADLLLEVGKFENRSAALVWLAREGIKAKGLELAEVKRVVEQIRQLKQSVAVQNREHRW